MLQTQEQKKSLETKSNEKEISDLPQKEYKIMVIKISKSGEHEKKKKEFWQREHFEMYQTEIIELKNTITEVKILI